MKPGGWKRSDVVALMVGIATLTFLWALGAGKELWFDERFVQVVSQMSWPEMFKLLLSENNPPLFFAIANIWQRLFGSSEVALRVVTLLPTLGFLFVLWHLAKRLAGRNVATLSVLIASLSGMVFGQAGEFRFYPWLTLWSASALLLVWSYLERPSRRTLFSLTIVNLVGVYTHYTYFFAVAFIAAWLFFSKWRTHWRELAVSFGLLAAAFVPWFWLSMLTKLQDLTINVGIQRLAADRWQVFLLPFRFILPPWFLDSPGLKIVRLIGLTVIGLSLLSFFVSAIVTTQPRKPKRFLLAFILSVAALHALTGLALPKYASILIPPIILAVAWGLTSLPLHKRVYYFLVVVLLAVAAIVAPRQIRQPFVTYGAAAKIVEQSEQETDRLLVYPFNDEIAVRPYYHGNLRVTGFLPIEEPDGVTIHDVVQYNFRVTLDEKNVERLAEYVGDSQRVWFFFDMPPSQGYWRGELIAQWFKEHGFTDTWYREIFQNVPPLLIRYDRLAS